MKKAKNTKRLCGKWSPTMIQEIIYERSHNTKKRKNPTRRRISATKISEHRRKNAVAVFHKLKYKFKKPIASLKKDACLRVSCLKITSFEFEELSYKEWCKR